MSVAGRSHIGLVRKSNEDNYYIDATHGLYLIADGIGGHQHGELASKMAVEVFVDHLKTHQDATLDIAIRDAIKSANAAVHAFQEANTEGRLMGTTLTAALIHEDTLYVGHVGDSRIYLSRIPSEIEQITQDHTYLAELAKHDPESFHNLMMNGFMDKKNYLVRAIGPEAELEPQFLQIKLQKGDRMILLTDGIYKYIPPLELLEVLNYTNDTTEVALRFEQLALERGGKDNLTSIVYFHERR